MSNIFRQGLSPLARGNRVKRVLRNGAWGSIPARAGQPPRRIHRPSCTRVYPRSRGATQWVRLTCGNHKGLSPLARGNHLGGVIPWLKLGSIPARAGQPCPAVPKCRVFKVYPRSRGATGICRLMQGA